MTGPRDFRARFIARIESTRIKGWVELASASRVMARVECAGAFRGLVVTLWERSDDGMGYVKLGVCVAPAGQSTVEGSKV